MTMGLENHRLRMGSTPLDELVQSVLGKSENRFQLVDPNHHLLLDTKNRLIHAHASPGVITVLKASVPLAPPLPADGTPLQVHDGVIQIGGNGNLPTGMKLPDARQLAAIHGVHEGHGKQWRAEDKKLYELTAAGWHAKDAGRDYSSLHSLGRDAVFGIDGDGRVRPVMTPDEPLGFVHKASDVAQTATGDLLAITKENETFNIEMLPTGEESQVHPFVIAGREAPLGSGDEPKAIGVADSSVFVATANGKLLRADLNQLPLSFGPVRDQPSLVELKSHRFTGLFTDTNGTLRARVKGGNGQEHICPMQDGTHRTPSFQLGWNISQALTLDSRRGLPGLSPPEHERLHLPYGSIALHDKQLMKLDTRSGLWKKTAEKDLKHVQVGQDKNAYIVTKDGEVKPLVVNQQAASHQFNDGPDLNLPGRTTEVKAGSAMPGMGSFKAEKIAVMNDQRFVSLNEGTLRVHDQKRPRLVLPPTPGGAPVTSLATGGKDLYVLSGGRIHRMEGKTWASQNITAIRSEAWKAVPVEGLRTGGIEALRTGGDGQVLAKTAAGEFELKNGAWEAVRAGAPTRLSSHGRFAALEDREALFGMPTSGHLPKLSPNAKFDATVFGRGNAQQLNYKQLLPTQMGFLKAHLLPTSLMKTPAMLKVAGDYVEHQYRGRAGLGEVYEAQQHALSEFDALRRASKAPPTQNLDQRINALKEGRVDPEIKELLSLFEWLSKEVSESTHLHLRTLGEHAPGIGLSTRNPLVPNSGNNSRYRPSSRTENNFITQMSEALQTVQLPTDSPTSKLLAHWTATDTVIDRTSKKMPGSRRDAHDEMSLVKARLAHNIVLLSEISDQLAVLEASVRPPPAVDPAPENAEEAPVAAGISIDTAAENLAALHNRKWGSNQLKLLTDAGFNNHKQLEADYDALKSILKYMRKEHHPLSMNLRQALDTNQEGIGAQLLAAVRELEPRENIKINRVYSGGGAATLGFDAGIATLGPRLSIDPERTYAMTLTRYDRGLKVSIGREGALTVGTSMVAGGIKSNAGGGESGNVPGSTEVHHSSSSSDTKDHQTLGGRFGGSVDIKNKVTQTQALSFFVREDEIDDFISDLTTKELHSSKTNRPDTLRPLDLIERGVEHEVRTGSKYNFDLEASIATEFRVSQGKTKAKPVSGFMRFGTGLVINQTLLSAERQRTSGRGDDGLNTKIRTDNRPRVMEQTKVTGYARLFDTAFIAKPDGAFIAGGIPTGITAKLVLNSKTGKSIDTRFKAAAAPEQSDLDTLEKSLKEAFPNVKLPTPPAGTAKPDVDTRFEALTAAYGGQAIQEDDSQYSALKSLRQMQRQVTAAKDGKVLMTTMEMTVTHNNLNRISNASKSKRAIDWATQCFGEVNEGNAGIVQRFMAEDPKLKELLETLQKGSGTKADVILELRDDVKEYIEVEAAAGRLTDGQLHRLVTDRNNLRIGAIAVFKAASKEDAFVLPTPWVNYSSSSSMSVERLQGEVVFEYGKDQKTPKSFKLKGEQSESDSGAARRMGAEDQRWV